MDEQYKSILHTVITSINHQSRFIHDDRARTIEEAILWHGGEAEASKQRYAALPKQKQQQLLNWLNQL